VPQHPGLPRRRRLGRPARPGAGDRPAADKRRGPRGPRVLRGQAPSGLGHTAAGLRRDPWRSDNRPGGQPAHGRPRPRISGGTGSLRRRASPVELKRRAPPGQLRGYPTPGSNLPRPGYVLPVMDSAYATRITVTVNGEQRAVTIDNRTSVLDLL